jgi:hypothetical protein
MTSKHTFHVVCECGVILPIWKLAPHLCLGVFSTGGSTLRSIRMLK